MDLSSNLKTIELMCSLPHLRTNKVQKRKLGPTDTGHAVFLVLSALRKGMVPRAMTFELGYLSQAGRDFPQWICFRRSTI